MRIQFPLGTPFYGRVVELGHAADCNVLKLCSQSSQISVTIFVDYSKIYHSLIKKRRACKPEGYFENHHILPKSLGGDDSPENLVALTGREHWVAHLLLHKIHGKSETAHACNMMAMRCEERGIPRIKNSRTYEWVRVEHSKYVSKIGKRRLGKKNGSYGTMWICNIELRANKKIKKDKNIPDGWVKGRNKWKAKTEEEKRNRVKLSGRKRRHGTKKCIYCGSEDCESPQKCHHYPYVKEAFALLGFNKLKLGSIDFYSEYDRIVEVLRSEYIDNKLSMQDIANKYKLNSHQRVRSLLKAFSIQRRTISDSVKNFHNSQ